MVLNNTNIQLIAASTLNCTQYEKTIIIGNNYLEMKNVACNRATKLAQ